MYYYTSWNLIVLNAFFKYFVEKHNLKATILLNSLELNDSSV